MKEIQMGLKSKTAYWTENGVEDVRGMQDGLLDDAIDRLPEVHAEELAARAQATGAMKAAKGLEARAAQMRAQREASDMAAEGEMPDMETGMPSDQPRGPETPTGPATQLRRVRKGLAGAVKPAPRNLGR